MKKQTALKILSEIKADLLDESKPKTGAMHASILSYLSEIFGDDSIQYDTFADTGIWNKGGLASAIQYVDDLTKFVQTLGVPKRPKDNFLTRINSNVLSAIISATIPGLIYVGFLFGQYTADIKNLRLERALKDVRDSIYLFRDLPMSMPAHNPNAADKKPADKNNISK